MMLGDDSVSGRRGAAALFPGPLQLLVLRGCEERMLHRLRRTHSFGTGNGNALARCAGAPRVQRKKRWTSYRKSSARPTRKEHQGGPRALRQSEGIHRLPFLFCLLRFVASCYRDSRVWW